MSPFTPRQHPEWYKVHVLVSARAEVVDAMVLGGGGEERDGGAVAAVAAAATGRGGRWRWREFTGVDDAQREDDEEEEEAEEVG